MTTKPETPPRKPVCRRPWRSAGSNGAPARRLTTRIRTSQEVRVSRFTPSASLHPLQFPALHLRQFVPQKCSHPHALRKTIEIKLFIGRMRDVIGKREPAD